jgi:hypothetical protein
MQPTTAASGVQEISHFPCCLYHKSKTPVVVRTKKEMDEMFKLGYSMSPSGVTQEEILMEQRKKLIAELAQVDEDLAAIRGVDVEDGVEEEAAPEDDTEDEPVNMLKGFEGGVPVAVTPTPAPKPASPPPRPIDPDSTPVGKLPINQKAAWAVARRMANEKGGKVSDHLAAAWAEIKA